MRIKVESAAHDGLIMGLREELARLYMTLEENNSKSVCCRIKHDTMRSKLEERDGEYVTTFE